MGAVLQLKVQGNWQPLAFFSKKLSPAQRKYNAYDRELLAIYEAVRHFRHMIEARHFTIYTDHKPLIFAFHQKRDKCSPRQFRHLDFIAQFSTDIQHVTGQENIVADTISRIDAISTPVTHTTLSEAQEKRGTTKISGRQHFHATRQNTGARYLSRALLRHGS